LAYARLVKPPDYYYFAIPAALAVFVLPGIFLAWRQKSKYRFFMILAGVLFSLFWTHRSRLISGQGQFIWCFYAALTVRVLIDRFISKTSRLRQMAVLGVMVLVFHVLGMQYSWGPHPHERGWKPLETPAMLWLGLNPHVPGVKAATIYYPKLVGACVWMVRELTGERDILFSNYDYAGGMVAVLSHRVTSTAMLPEIRPFKDFNPLLYSHAVLWFKDPENPSYPLALTTRYGFELSGESELAYLFINPVVTAKKETLAARVPLWVCFSFLTLAVTGIFYPPSRRKPRV
jgi:hypothetical protein